MTFTATYSPEDNKIRLSASQRLDKELYERVKAAGFSWAPKQGIFVAPMWTPEREDLAVELAGELEDEDTSLVERAEQRAERFEDYSEKRLRDAEQAKAGVDRIADGIPMGQPILVGHHSERHARKDAERIENGMRRAVKMWETSKYWEDRAAGAIAHAKHKERPDVRARRIKGLEADLRRLAKQREAQVTARDLWAKCAAMEDPEKQRKFAELLAGSAPDCNFRMPRKEGDWEQGNCDAYTALTNYYPNLYKPRTLAEVIAEATTRKWYTEPGRWNAHYENRLLYERAMLAEGGGLVADQFDFAIGGQIKRRGEWLVIAKLNRKGGVLMSLSVFGHFASTVPVEDVQDYRPPTEGAAEKVAKVTEQKPLCNWKAPGCIEMTTAEWKEKSRFDSYAVRHFSAEHKYTWGGRGDAKQVYRQRSYYRMGNGTVTAIFLTDGKVTEPPKQADLIPAEPVHFDREPRDERPVYRAPEPTEFDAMKDALRTGNAVQVVSAPQLFPTPAELAERMVQEAGIEPDHAILEPSAGTGRLLDALYQVPCGGRVVAVEVNATLAHQLKKRFVELEVVAGDFLAQNGNLGKFDRILMNPPFALRADIEHIQHAVKFLKPGGRLVAICANGPRQQEALKPIAEASGGWYEPLPAGSFEASGTGVNAALLVIEA